MFWNNLKYALMTIFVIIIVMSAYNSSVSKEEEINSRPATNQPKFNF